MHAPASSPEPLLVPSHSGSAMDISDVEYIIAAEVMISEGDVLEAGAFSDALTSQNI